MLHAGYWYKNREINMVLRLIDIHIRLADESEATLIYKEPLLADEHQFSL